MLTAAVDVSNTDDFLVWVTDGIVLVTKDSVDDTSAVTSVAKELWSFIVETLIIGEPLVISVGEYVEDIEAVAVSSVVLEPNRMKGVVSSPEASVTSSTALVDENIGEMTSPLASSSVVMITVDDNDDADDDGENWVELGLVKKGEVTSPLPSISDVVSWL